MILDHREVIRKKKKVTEYLVRWLGYDASNDTWEPEENILGDCAKEQIRLYWDRKKLEESNLNEKEEDKPKKGSKKKRVSIVEDKQTPVAKKKNIENEEELKTTSTPTTVGESAVDMSDETNHTWFGIKEEDIRTKGAKREFKNLYVSDRKLTLSEKVGIFLTVY